MSTLSPRNKWNRNKSDTSSLLNAKLEGWDMESFKVCTFTRLKKKCWELLDRDYSEFDPDEFFTGLKTRCFWDNIVYRKSERVTIDTWAARAAFNNLEWKDTVRPKVYRELEKEYIESAEKVGEIPKDFQAMIWVSFRNKTKYANV